MKHRRPLRIETLEARRNMSLVLGFDGHDRLNAIAEDAGGQTAAVTLQVDAAGQLNVREGAADLGTFRVAPRLDVALGQVAPGFANLLELDGHQLTTNLNVKLGDQGATGPNQFRILGGRAGTAGEGTLQGHVNVKGGSGSQFFVFGELGRSIPHIINITGSVGVDMGPGGETAPDAVGSVGVPPATAQVNIGGHLDVHQSTIFVIAGRVGGNLTVNSPAKDVNQLVVLGNFGRPLSVGGRTIIRTGGGNDSISLENATLSRDLYVFSGGGDDHLELANSDPGNGAPEFAEAPAAVHGFVFLALGAGNDTVDFGAESLVSPGSTVPLRIGGGLFVSAGSGDDTLNFFDARIDGRFIDLVLSDGDDQLNLQRLHAPRAHMFAFLGSGDDTLTVGEHADLALQSLLVDGGVGWDTFQPGNWRNLRFLRRTIRFEA